MTRNEWEEGTIILPSAEFARVRKSVQQADTEHKERIFGLTQEFWNGLSRKQQTDPEDYRRAGLAFVESRERVQARFSGLGHTPFDDGRAAFFQDLSEALNLDGRGKPSRVLKSDMDFPTNRTVGFTAGEGFVSFDKKNSTVLWQVDEGNGAVLDARSHPVSKAFFEAVDTVKWTRGTGGFFTGNDEYHREDSQEGGGENYVTTAFGPIGANWHVDRCRPYTDSKGRKVTQQDLNALSRTRFLAQMEAQRKASEAYANSIKASGAQPRGHNGHAGQFTYRSHGEPTIRL